MIKELVKEEKWIDALSLNERYVILKDKLKYSEIDYIELEKWRNRKGLLSEESHKNMNKLYGYKESIFSYAIKEDYEDTKKLYEEEIENYDFYNTVKRIYKIIETDNTVYSNEFSLSFILRPFLFLFNKEIDGELDNLCLKINHNNIYLQLKETLINKLLNISLKTIILEINLFKENNIIVGETEEERYHNIISKLGTKGELYKIYDKYPVLVRTLIEMTLTYIHNLKYMFKNLNENNDKLNQKFNLKEDKLNLIKFDLGDTHQGGKTVLILEFTSGKKLLYKPKDLQIVNSYNNLIEFINKRRSGVLLDLPKVETIIFKDFAIEEFIDNSKCKNEHQIKRYYKRFGQVAAIMYMLKGNDFHMENIIAKDEYPIIVDLETLFHNTVEMEYNYGALKEAIKVNIENVSNTGLLPSNNFFLEKGVAIDLSGMNGRSQELPVKILQPVNLNTDKIKYDYSSATLPPSNNLPILQNKIVEYKGYIDDILDGFKNMCLFFYDNKKELLNEVYPDFIGKKVRVLIRNTKNYAKILEATHHPKYFRNYLEKEKILENIWALPLVNKTITKSEYNDLSNNDIPIFFSVIGSKDLIDSRGVEYKNFFEKSVYELAKNKLINLDEKKINEQIDIIKIHTSYSSFSQKFNSNIAINDIKDNDYKELDFLEEAKKIGDKILDRAIYCSKDGTYCWLHQPYEKEGKIDFIDASFYNGLSGLSLFYFYLYKLTGETKYEKVYKDMVESSNKLVNNLKGNSIVTGKGSLLYSLYKIYLDTDDYTYKEKMNTYLNYLSKTINEINDYDWINGIASVLSLVIDIYDELKEEEYYLLIMKLADRLEILLKQNDFKIESGFAHGASSLSMVFMKLNNLTKESKYSNLAIKLLNIDRQSYSYKHGAWISFDNDNKETIRHHWCHGSIGIGISRIKLKEYCKEEGLEGEISKCTELLLNNTFDESDTLCHGNMGTCDFMLNKYIQEKNVDDYELVKKIMQQVIEESKLNDSYMISTVKSYNSVGLFNGLAGIGYQCLRVHAPEVIPSILLFE